MKFRCDRYRSSQFFSQQYICYCRYIGTENHGISTAINCDEFATFLMLVYRDVNTNLKILKLRVQFSSDSVYISINHYISSTDEHVYNSLLKPRISVKDGGESRETLIANGKNIFLRKKSPTLCASHFVTTSLYCAI